MAFLNIVIPTCDRAETLYWTIKTCLDQDYYDYKIWVSNNKSQDNTKSMIMNFNDPRIIYLETPEKLVLSDSWEYALEQIKEGYVCIQGSDDGFLPNSLKYIDSLLKKYYVDALVSFPIIFEWSNSRYNKYNDNRCFLVNSTELINDYVKSLEYAPEFWLSPTIYHNFINIDVINKIKKRDKRFFNSYAPDLYSNMILLPEIDRYILSYIPFAIDGVSNKSSGLAQSITRNVDENTKKIQNEIFGNSNKKSFHHKLENEKYRINSWPFSLVLADPILQAHEMNKEVPELDIKDLLSKIVYSDSYTKRFDYDETQIMLETAKNIAKINNIEDFVDNLIKDRHFKPKDCQVLDKLRFNMKTFTLSDSLQKDIYALSRFLLDSKIYNPENLMFKNLETVHMKEQKYVLFKNDIIMNSKIIMPLNKELNKEVNIKYKNINFVILYDFDVLEEIYDKYSENYLILKYDYKLNSLPNNIIAKINLLSDQIWVSNNHLLDIYVNSGIDIDKIVTIPQGIDINLYKRTNCSNIENNRFKFLYVGDLSSNSGIYTLIDCFIEEFINKDSIYLIIKNDYSGNLENINKVKSYINSYKDKININNIIISNDSANLNDLIKLYSSVNCLVYPFKLDNTCSHILEAMSCELPIITSNYGCVNEYCSELNSYLVNGEIIISETNFIGNIELTNYLECFEINRHNLNKAMRDAVYNKDKLLRMGKESRKFIENNLNISSMFNKIENNISNLKNAKIFRSSYKIIKEKLEKEAYTYLKNLNYLDAERKFNKLCKYENDNKYYYNLGISQFMQGKYEDAIQSFSNVLENGLISHELLVYIAKSLEKIGDSETAELYYDKAKQLSN